MNLHFTFWDYLLIAVVAVQGTFLAYVYHPKWKSFLLTLPFPFTVAFLAVAQPIDATNMIGLVFLLMYTHGVRIFHNKFKIPIVPAIFLSAFTYCVVGLLVNRLLVKSDGVFWTCAAASYITACVSIVVFPHRTEKGQKSPLPVWLKLITIVAVVLILVVIKRGLGGFVTVFPMVGIVAAYEARKSLWTISRQIPVVMLTMGTMMVVMKLCQAKLGPYGALGVGWLVFLAILIPTTRMMWRRQYGTAATKKNGE